MIERFPRTVYSRQTFELWSKPSKESRHYFLCYANFQAAAVAFFLSLYLTSVAHLRNRHHHPHCLLWVGYQKSGDNFLIVKRRSPINWSGLGDDLKCMWQNFFICLIKSWCCSRVKIERKFLLNFSSPRLRRIKMSNSTSRWVYTTEDRRLGIVRLWRQYWSATFAISLFLTCCCFFEQRKKNVANASHLAWSTDVKKNNNNINNKIK